MYNIFYIFFRKIAMLPSNSNESSSSYAYVGGMLNVVYLSGFVRNPHENGFFLQQTNNINHAIPVKVEGKHRKFREREPITVIAHGYGERNSDGVKTLILKAIKVEVPTLLTMPDELVWNSRLPEGMADEEFKPFGEKWAEKLKLADKEPDHVSEIFEATGGRFDGTLGASSNNFRCAGFVEGYAMSRDSKGEVTDDCLTLLVRQHKDPEMSIPVRLYGRYAQTYFKYLSVGRPVRVDGQVRVSAKPQEDGSMKYYTYVHTSQLRGADQEVGIRRTPEWVADMKIRILKDRTEKEHAAVARKELKAKESSRTELDDTL